MHIFSGQAASTFFLSLFLVTNAFSAGGPWKHFEVGHSTFKKIARFIEKFCFICVTTVERDSAVFGLLALISRPQVRYIDLPERMILPGSLILLHFCVCSVVLTVITMNDAAVFSLQGGNFHSNYQSIVCSFVERL